MAGTISFGGIGSGLDTEGIIKGLVSASGTGLSSLKSRAAATRSAVSELSDVGSLLAKLKSALSALSDDSGVKSYKATSSGAAVTASASASAQAGAWSVQVQQLAKEQRNYSSTFASSSTALGQTGTLSIQVGAAAAKNVSIEATDTLDSLVTKIGASGARVSAAVFYDGTNNRLQVRGLDTGADNALTFTETGTSLGLTLPGSVVQSAQNSQAVIDGFTVSRSSNQISGALPGVTLNLTDTTASALNVKVEADPAALKSKIESFVSAYNAVVNKVHQAAGFATTKAQNPVLAGDSLLRSITSKLSSSMLTSVTGAGTYGSLSSLGVSLTKEGTISFDSAKLDTALAADSGSVAKVLAGVSGDDGVMDVLADVVDSFNQTGTGLIATKKETLEQRAKTIDARVDREQKHLDWYEEMLRRQFSNMDGSVSGSNAQTDYLSAIMNLK